MAVRPGRFVNLHQGTFVYFTIDTKQLAIDSSGSVHVDEKILPIKSNYSMRSCQPGRCQNEICNPIDAPCSQRSSRKMEFLKRLGFSRLSLAALLANARLSNQTAW